MRTFSKGLKTEGLKIITIRCYGSESFDESMNYFFSNVSDEIISIDYGNQFFAHIIYR